MGRDDINQPGPSSLSSSDAHSLIHLALTGEELHPSAVVALAKWALARDERVDELEERLSGFARTTKALAELRAEGLL